MRYTFVVSIILLHRSSGWIPHQSSVRRESSCRCNARRPHVHKYTHPVPNRAQFFTSVISTMSVSCPVLAFTKDQDRTTGYPIQHTEEEWSRLLSPTQYDILRLGKTERPFSSILEGEEQDGLYVCAGCNNPLFTSQAKFHSGTGWPSFASALKGVEIESTAPFKKTLIGAELRCNQCGGHLGDVFQDGFLFIGTPAFQTGERYCIDGAALIFLSD